jgi:hypothetical protein
MADLYVKRAMLPTMFRFVVALVLVGAAPSLAQQTPDVPPPKVVVVPYPGSDQQPAPPPQQPAAQPAPAPQPVAQPAPPSQPPPDAPPAEPPPETRTIDAVPPPPLPPEQLDNNPRQIEPTGPGVMIDGHPREGAFLSGPGSFTFLMHHTLMTGLGGLATQMIPRAIQQAQGVVDTKCDATPGGTPAFTNSCARIAYLGLGLGGAAVGFAGSAVWQFTHWISERSANFGIVNSFLGGMFLGAFTDLLTKDAYAIAWMTVIGNTLGAWLSIIIGGGDLPLNHGVLITSGAAWAGIFTALIVGIIASTGGGTTARSGMDAIMLTPALGATAMALATLKFNPSTAQIMRANIFGLGVGGAVLLISALVLGANFNHPLPYILAGVGAIGSMTLVSLLWAEAAEPGLAPSSTPDAPRQRVSVWW